MHDNCFGFQGRNRTAQKWEMLDADEMPIDLIICRKRKKRCWVFTGRCPFPGLVQLVLSLVLIKMATAAIDIGDEIVLHMVIKDLNCQYPANVLGLPPCLPPRTVCDGNNRLTEIRLSQLDSCNGILSPLLANLTELTYIELSMMHLHGIIPASIGTLVKLRTLILSINNLNGSIPVEIGDMTSLETLLLDSNVLSGIIPASFGRLNKLKRLRLDCNGLQGKIPVEIGNLSSLTEMKLHSNNLSGQLPDTMSNLTNVTTLSLNNNQLSGSLNLQVLYPGKLEYLYLHRNNFSGPIPDLGQINFPLLKELDLRFNQLSGPLPPSVASISKLVTRLYLGHNQLEGPIPESYSNLKELEFLQVLDLSHNALNGSLRPIFGLMQQVEFDVSFNFFVAEKWPHTLMERSNTLFSCRPTQLGLAAIHPVSSAPSCQPYTSGDNAGFAINAGDRRDITSKRTVFQSDASLLRWVPTGIEAELSREHWAVQTSGKAGGVFSDRNTTVQGTGTENPDLYQSMRWSSGYLAYFGRSMKRGRFRVKLHFAELNFEESGWRVFDVVVQGQTITRSLDVVATVGWKAAYVIDHEVQVSDDGLLRIELIQVSPANRAIDTDRYRVPHTGPMISALSVEAVPIDNNGQPERKSKNVVVLIAVMSSVAGVVLVVSLIAFRSYCFVLFNVHRERWRKRRVPGRTEVSTQFGEFSGSAIGPTFYSYNDLFVATDGFSEANKLGQGGFGAVFKGVLADETVVAIKQLTKESKQSREAFRKEIAIISTVQHRNLLSLKGCCLDSKKPPLLVSDYMPNGSLDKLLHGPDSQCLDWESRKNIATGAACGLAYLHEESRHRIIHCDMKPANILLDKDFNALIADFGLALRLYDEGTSHITTTNIRGTLGYLAPEYTINRLQSAKADVYSFGVVLLEILSGRRIMNFELSPEKTSLVKWAQTLGQAGQSSLLQLMDARLRGQRPEEKELLDMATIAIWCTQTAPNLRPTMRQVWLMLKGTINVPGLPSRGQSIEVESSELSAYYN